MTIEMNVSREESLDDCISDASVCPCGFVIIIASSSKFVCQIPSGKTSRCNEDQNKYAQPVNETLRRRGPTGLGKAPVESRSLIKNIFLKTYRGSEDQEHVESVSTKTVAV